ncbi:MULTISPECIES: hypothetical protein [unclassified Vibrio]|uniref:hypothetical protein n=1 Tax=unclassified Vibrio TaxID=2614977 RepID=UPI002159018B|nr:MULTISPECIES: hypothetical protein [unclassified Vibrio]
MYQRFESNIKTLEKRFVRLGLIELQECDSENSVLANNIWRPDRKGGVAGLLMRQQSQQNIYYMTNHLGHVYGVFDQAGERLSQRGYSPYGQVSGDGFTLQPFGVSAKRSDFESGLVYLVIASIYPVRGAGLTSDCKEGAMFCLSAIYLKSGLAVQSTLVSRCRFPLYA